MKNPDKKKQAQVFTTLCNVQDIYEISNIEMMKGIIIYVSAIITESPDPAMIEEAFIEEFKQVMVAAINLKTQMNKEKN